MSKVAIRLLQHIKTVFAQMMYTLPAHQLHQRRICRRTNSSMHMSSACLEFLVRFAGVGRPGHCFAVNAENITPQTSTRGWTEFSDLQKLLYPNYKAAGRPPELVRHSLAVQ